MRSGMLAFWGLVLLLLAGLMGVRQYQHRTPSQPAAAGAATAERRVVDFSLTERSGRTITGDDLAGKVWVAGFFFSNCPGVCLKLNQAMAQLQKETADTDVQLVSITVDPEHDTPERLTEYAARFNADPDRWWFLTGPMPEIQRLAEESFAVSAMPGTHSERLMIIDRTGRVRASFRGSEEAQIVELKHKLADIVKEST